MVEGSPFEYYVGFYDFVLWIWGIFLMSSIKECVDGSAMFLNPLGIIWSFGSVILAWENPLVSPDNLDLWKYGSSPTYSPYLSGWASGYYEGEALTFCYGTHMDLRCVCSEEIVWAEKRYRKTFHFLLWTGVIVYFMSLFGFYEFVEYIGTEAFYDPIFVGVGHTAVSRFVFWALYTIEALEWIYVDTCADDGFDWYKGLDFPREYHPFGDLFPTLDTFIYIVREGLDYSWKYYDLAPEFGKKAYEFLSHQSAFCRSYVGNEEYGGYYGYFSSDEVLGWYRKLGDLDPNSTVIYGYKDLHPWFRDLYAPLSHIHRDEFHTYTPRWNLFGGEYSWTFNEWFVENPHAMTSDLIDFPAVYTEDFTILSRSLMFNETIGNFVVFNHHEGSTVVRS